MYRLSIVMLVLGLPTAIARADDITYNIVDYPANESDQTSAGTDTISGTIITDGTIGPLSTANIIGGTFSFTGPYGTLTGPVTVFDPIGLQATPTQLLLSPGSDSHVDISTTESNLPTTYPPAVQGLLGMADVEYQNYPGDSTYGGSVAADLPPPSLWFGALFRSSPVPTTPGSIGANSSWVVATVPEPSTFVLFCIGAVCLAAHAWRRKRRAA